MRFTHDHFTMSYAQSCDYGIDYRDFDKVGCLPKEVEVVAIAGVWGDYRNIRCLFADYDGNGYLRNIYKVGNAYLIKELGVDAKEISVGQSFRGLLRLSAKSYAKPLFHCFCHLYARFNPSFSGDKGVSAQAFYD